MSLSYAATKSDEKTNKRLKVGPGGTPRRGPVLTREERAALGQRTYKKPSTRRTTLKWTAAIALFILFKWLLYLWYGFVTTL